MIRVGPRSQRAAALLVAVLAAICYAGSFDVPFLYDDLPNIADPSITGFHPSPASRRFLGDLSFAISYRISGEDPAGYHAVNLAIHIVNALLVLWLVRLLWRTEPLGRSRLAAAGPGIALTVSLFFAVHPIQTEAVTYVVQRFAALAATFFFLSVCSYVLFRLSGRRSSATGWYALFLASAAAAFWTKENAVVLPLTVLLIEVAFFDASPRRRLLFLLPLFAIVTFVAAGLVLRAGAQPGQLDLALRSETDLARIHYALTQIRVVASYLQLLFVPLGQNVDHDVAISRSFLEPGVLIAASLHAAMLLGAFLAFFRGSRSEPAWRIVGFGVVWFYLALLVESSFIPLGDVMNEHRIYLPSFGVLLAAVALASMYLPRKVLTVAAAVLAIGLGALTFARNEVWRSDLTLWADAARKSPNKARPLNNLGVAMLDRGDTLGASEMFRRAILVDPTHGRAYYNLAESLQTLGDCRQAITLYRIFSTIAPEYPPTYRNLALCLEETGDAAQARTAWQKYERVSAEFASRPAPMNLR